MRVLVTGGLGFIGARLCGELLERGYAVTCVDRLSGAYAPGRGLEAVEHLEEGGARVRVGDAGRVDLGRELAGVAALVHLAALPGVRSRLHFGQLWHDNVLLARRAAEAAARAGARLLLASSSSVYGHARRLPTPEDEPLSPLSPYAVSKLAAEAAARSYGGDVVVARPFTVFGPGQRPDMAIARWIAAIAGDQPVTWHVRPGGARELTHVDDAVRGLVAALERGRSGEAYNLGGTGSHSMDEVLGEIESALGRSAARLRRPPLKAEAARTEACKRKSATELGYRPSRSLTDGIREQVEAAVGEPAPA